VNEPLLPGEELAVFVGFDSTQERGQHNDGSANVPLSST
jgi:hypothetical protein